MTSENEQDSEDRGALYDTLAKETKIAYESFRKHFSTNDSFELTKITLGIAVDRVLAF